MKKFNRNYKLFIQSSVKNTMIEITPPLTIEFTVSRGIMATLNNMEIRIYNLAKSTRDQIFQDWYNLNEYKQIILMTGYDDLNLTFSGNVFRAYSYRQGNNIITYIKAFDGGFDMVNNTVSATIGKTNTTNQSLVDFLISKFTYVKKGNITAIEGSPQRATVFDGSTYDILQKYTNGKTFIDLEKINVMKDNDVIEGDVPLINSDSGLIGTPIRNDAYLEINMIFEPRILVAQVIEIKSSINSQYDG